MHQRRYAPSDEHVTCFDASKHSDFEHTASMPPTWLDWIKSRLPLVDYVEEDLAPALIAANLADGKQRNNRNLSPASFLGAMATQKHIALLDLNKRVCTLHSCQWSHQAVQ